MSRKYLKDIPKTRLAEPQQMNDKFRTSGQVMGSIAIGRDITKRKQLERQLQESEKKYRAIVENSPNLIGIFQDGVLKYVNNVGIHKLGWTYDELVSPSFDPIEKVVSEKSRNLLKANVAKRLRGEDVEPYKISLTRKDGSEIPVVVRAARIIYEARPAIQFSFTDLTERMVAEMKARDASLYSRNLIEASEERFRHAMEATSDGLWDWNVETGKIYYSPAYSRILGYEPSELQDDIQTWKELMHPDDRDRAIRVNEDCIENRIPKFEVEYRMRTKSGEWKWILGRGKATARSADGRAIRMIGTHVDITERKRMEHELKNHSENLEAKVEERTTELRLTKERLDYLITSNPATIYSGKPLADLSDWELTYLSDRVVPMLGFSPEKFIGHPEFSKQRVHPQDLGPMMDAVPRLWEKGQHVFEYRTMHKNGDYRWIRNEARVARDGDGKPIEVNGYWTDITEKKRVELENEKLNTELTTRLSDVTDRLESLAKSREKLKAAPDVATGLDAILETVLWDFDLDFGAVLVLDRQANRMNVRASKSKAKEIRLNESYPLQGFVELRDLQTKSVTRVVGMGDSSIFGTAIVHSIPILASNEIYGVLAFGNEEPHSLRESSVRILELYAELVSSFMIEKPVAVTPVLESKIAERMSGLESGQMYLVKKDPAKAFDVFAGTVFSGYEGLCVTRMYPPKVRTKYGLEKTPIVWLTSEASEGEKSVHSIQDLSIMIGDYLVKAEKAVVLIDGFEYLITNHGFESFLKFLQIVKDRLQRQNAILIAPVLEQALAPKELALIEREMQALDDSTRSDSETIAKSR